MQGFKRILVGVDLNERTGELPAPTKVAIREGLSLARLIGAELTFLTVLSTEYHSEASAIPESDESPEKLVERQVAELIQSTGESKPNIVSKLAYGKGWYELVREALRLDADLLIVGTRELSTTQRMLYGSTGLKLIRNCPCAVLITRPDLDPEDGLTIVAADDFSPVGQKVLHTAVSTAQLINARLAVVHAVDYPFEGGMMRTSTPQNEIEAYRQKCREDAEVELQERLSMTDYRTLQQGTKMIVRGGPADLVVDEVVRELNAEILVLGTLARGGIPGFLIGNTAERLLPLLNCSLLAIKPEGYVSPVKVN